MSDKAFIPGNSTNPNQQHDYLIVFTRYPEPGKTKTRLIPALGPKGAARVQQQMTEWTLKQAQLWQQQVFLQPTQIQTTASVEIRFAGGNHEQMQHWLGTKWKYVEQGDGDLGSRLIRAFQTAFDQGATAVIAIGIDCPGITVEILSQAYHQLQEQDSVIGPAEDGGYYLIGLRHPLPEFFQQIDWGTETVRQQTLAIATSMEVTVAQLPPLADVDRPEDLLIWHQYSTDKQATHPGRLSVILPVLNEEDYIQRTLQSVFQAATTSNSLEVIVVDGGSSDNTIALVEKTLMLNMETNSCHVKTITSTTGRANQMNAGAAVATGEYLLFLHADTQVPVNAFSNITQTLKPQNVIAGAFELAIQGTQHGFRLIEWGIKWRSRLLQMPYGDQAIFLKATTFQDIGGFPRLPIMEDFEFIRQLRKKGKVAIAPATVTTSGRRWQKLGLLQTTFINQIIICAYLIGIQPYKIVQMYKSEIKTPSLTRIQLKVIFTIFLFPNFF